LEKEENSIYFLFFIFFLVILLIVFLHRYIRYFYPFLGLLIIYALLGLELIKSRIFLSSIFFINLWGLLSTKVSLSQSRFLSPIEGSLSVFSTIAQFIYDYKLILAVGLGLFFYFFISQKRHSKYLILLLICAYLVKSSVVQIGSWLNIWLPILFLIFIVLFWRLLLKFKEGILRKLVITYIIILLVLNSWGLASLYFLAYHQFTFPNPRETYVDLPQIAKEIEKLEGESRDFYVFVAFSSGLDWYHNYKVVKPGSYGFHVITDLQYRNDLTASEIHNLFQRSKIKYLVQNNYRPKWPIFFDKIESRSDLFEPILRGEESSLWRVVKTKA